MHHDSTGAVLRVARGAARTIDAPMLLAVSGGLDSMALLHAMAATSRARIAGVATFDHGTGESATAAAAYVARTAVGLRLPVVSGRIDAECEASTGDGREAAWRRARYRFLHAVAVALGARLVTAHTEDDQVETVLMRVMRGSGARGLAALYAPSAAARPFIGLRRELLARFASESGIAWRDDPSNDSRDFVRNRIRHDILPALRVADPRIDDELLGVARRAAGWRAEVERFVDVALRPQRRGTSTLIVAARELAGYDRDSLCVLWSSLAGRVGLALDRRGTRRLAAFTIRAPRSGTVPLSGGWCMDARGDDYILEKRAQARSAPMVLPELGELMWGDFRFRVTAPVAPAADADAGAARIEAGSERWTAALPMAVRASVRAWSAGDRLAKAGAQPPRRVKRYLSEAGVRGLDRAAWPVVVAGEKAGGGTDVVWIPGVRRADAATERSGRPVRYYVCERIDR